MSAASVGFHCPECTSAGAQKVLRPGDLRSKPVFTYGVLALIAVAFVAQGATSGGGFLSGVVVDEGVLWGPYVERNEWWRIVTSGFLHSGLMHVGFNAYALYLFGPTMERLIGPLRTAIVYAGGLFGGAAAVLAFDFTQATLGASGAVLGLAGGLAAVLMVNGQSIRQTSLGGIFFLNLALPILVPRISFWGHFGGIAGGFAVGYVIGWAMKQSRPRRASEHGPVIQGGADQSIPFGLATAAMVALVAVGAGLSGGLL